jgi:hypothetical protein
MDALAYLEMALKLAPAIIQAGEDIGSFAKTVYTAINSGSDPTDADWQALKDKEVELRNALQAPLD